MSQVQTPVAKFTGYQKFVIALLAFLQFTIVLDFMIVSPLGAILMPALHISPAQFGTIVSAYAFSAGISGFLSASFADRFDRKKLLLFFYAGFIGGTLFCGLANDFHTLLIARMVTGVFGGVIGAIIFAIVTDLFPLNMRGRVLGMMQSSFGASQILGIPAGLYFSNLWNWHAPFMLIVAVCVIVSFFIVVYLRPIDEHLKYKSDRNMVLHLAKTVTNRNYTLAFFSMSLLSLGGFMLMPFGSAYSVNNLGVGMDHLPSIYLATGISAMFVGPIVGRLTDQFGKYRIFFIGCLASMVMILVYTNLGITPLPLVLLVNVLLFCAIFSRMIPAQAMTSAIPEPAARGAFMAVTASLQYLAGGVASIVAGLIVTEHGGKIDHFDQIGYIVVTTIVITAIMMYFVNRQVHAKVQQSLGHAI